MGATVRSIVGAALFMTTVSLAIGCTASEAPQEEAALPSSLPNPTSRPTAQPELEPQAIVAHPSRGSIDISTATGRQVIAGVVDNWRDLGQPAAPMEVITEGPADRRLRAVAHDPDAIAIIPASLVRPEVAAIQVDGVDPLREPARYPLLAEGEAPPPQPVTITVAGDVMMARDVAEAMGDDFFAPLRPVAPYLKAADLTIGNLESSLSQDGSPTQGTDSFGADPRVVASLERAGFDVLSLANNHVGDYGSVALDQTINRLDASTIQRVGAGHNARDAWRPAVISVADTRVGVLAFNAIGESPAATSSSPGTIQIRMPPRTGPLNTADLDAMVDSVGSLADRVDVVLVIPHWGDQYTSIPIPVQRRVAHSLTHAGASVVLGGHPHWVQGLELSRDSLIAYSLGNFIFDMDFSKPTMQGFALDLTFWDGQLMSATPVPIRIDSQFRAHVVTGQLRDQILDDIWTNSFGSLRN